MPGLPPRHVCVVERRVLPYLTLPQWRKSQRKRVKSIVLALARGRHSRSYVLMYMSASVCHVEGDTAFKNTGGSRDKHGADRHRSQRYTGTDDTKYFTCCMRTNANGNASKPCAPPRRPSVRRDAPSEPMRILQMSPRKGGRRACSIVQSFHFVHTRPTCMNELSLVWARQAQTSSSSIS